MSRIPTTNQFPKPMLELDRAPFSHRSTEVPVPADEVAVPVQTRSNPPLSPTERRVYDLLLQRQTERQVAENLGRSPNTVHVHVRNIYRKLGVRTRQELLKLPVQSIKAVRRNA